MKKNNLESMEKKKMESGYYIEELGIDEVLNQNILGNELIENWMSVNDHITLERVPNEEIPEGESFLLNWEEDVDGQRRGCLKVPSEMRLWDIIGITEEIDNDAFKNNPEIIEGKKELIEKSGDFFFDINKYLEMEMGNIDEKNGRMIAQSMSQMCEDYGEKYFSRIKKEDEMKDLKEKDLSEEEIEKVEKFIFGENLYNSRFGKVEDEEEIKKIREKTLNQFFRVAQKSFELEKKELKENIPANPLMDSTPIHSKFLENIRESLISKIEKPKEEMIRSIFQRGLELLNNNLEASRPEVRQKLREIEEFKNKIENGYLKLRDIVGIEDLKKELAEIRERGKIEEINEREKEIASKIKKAVSSYGYKSSWDNPSKIVEDEEMNCLGFAEVGGRLYQEAGLSNGIINIKGHVLSCWADSENNFYWNDLRDGGSDFGYLVKNEDLEGKNSDGGDIKIQDLIDAMSGDFDGSLIVGLKPAAKNSHDFYGIEKQFLFSDSPRFRINNLENGALTRLLSNSARRLLDDLKREYSKALANEIDELLKYSLRIDGNNVDAMHILADLHFVNYEKTEDKEDKGLNKEMGIKYLKKSLKLDKNDPHAIFRLAEVLSFLDKKDEAIGIYREAMDIPFRPLNGNLLFSFDGFAKNLSKRGGADDKKEALYYYHKFTEYLRRDTENNNSSLSDEERNELLHNTNISIKKLEDDLNISNDDFFNYKSNFDYLLNTFSKAQLKTDDRKKEMLGDFVDDAEEFLEKEDDLDKMMPGTLKEKLLDKIRQAKEFLKEDKD